MKNGVMTELQRQSLEHFEQARREGLSISAYAAAHGISKQRIYDAVGRLRGRGQLAGKSRASERFVAVKIGAPLPAGGAAVCRVAMSGGLLIECLQWPPRSWLESFARAADAAA